MELRGRFRRLFGNAGLKILAFILAVLFWVFIMSGRVAYREIEAPVELEGVPEGVTVGGPTPDSVSVRVAGKGRDLFRVREADFKVMVNVSGRDAGTHTIALTPSDVVYSGGRDVTVEEILSDRTVGVELERRITKGVPIKAEFSGTPASGYYLGIPAVEPAKATLYGSVTVLDKVRAVSVIVDAEGRSESFAADVPIKAPAGITLVGADEARVSVPVGPGERRTLSGVRVGARGSGTGTFRLSPAVVSVTVEGEAGRLAALGRVTAEVYPRGRGRYPVKIEVPDYVTLVSVSPPEIEVAPATE
jgi:YbbR domain-containing protein